VASGVAVTAVLLESFQSEKISRLTVEFRCQTGLFPTLQLEEHMFLAGKVEEEGSVRRVSVLVSAAGVPRAPMARPEASHLL
jgi:hypothetical protein